MKDHKLDLNKLDSSIPDQIHTDNPDDEDQIVNINTDRDTAEMLSDREIDNCAPKGSAKQSG